VRSVPCAESAEQRSPSYPSTLICNRRRIAKMWCLFLLYVHKTAIQSSNQSLFQAHGPYESREDRQKIFTTDRPYTYIQEAQLSPSDRAMRLVSSNLANYHATVQKLLIRQVLSKPIVWSWRFSSRQCVINKPTTVELCISPVYRRLALAKFSKSTM